MADNTAFAKWASLRHRQDAKPYGGSIPAGRCHSSGAKKKRNGDIGSFFTIVRKHP
jgi:hypothetical protein